MFANTVNADIHDLTMEGEAQVWGSDDSGVLIGNMVDGSVRNVKVNQRVNLTDGNDNVGGLIGQVECNTGEVNISNVRSNDSVVYDANADNWGYGGLIGYVDAGTENCEINIDQAHANGDVFTGDYSDAGSSVGGLIGEIDAYNYDTASVHVTNSYTKNYLGYSSSQVGGLIGSTFASDGADISISKSFSTGEINADADSVGGLVGYVYGGSTLISESYSSSNIYGTGNLGGLVGTVSSNTDPTTIEQSFSTGDVNSTGNGQYFGGLAGSATNLEIYDSYTTSAIFTDNSYVGGIAGELTGDIVNSYTSGNFYVGGSDNVGGLVGVYRGSNSEGENGLKNNFIARDFLASGGNDNTAAIVGRDETNNNLLNLETNYNDDTRFFTNGVCSIYGVDSATTSCGFSASANFQGEPAGRPFINESEDALWNFSDIWVVKNEDFPRLRWNYTQPSYDISTCEQLQAMDQDLGGDYELVDDIDCSDTDQWNGGQGFMPIGYLEDEDFNGTFDGNNHTITGLFQDGSDPDEGFNAGLFYSVRYGDISNTKLEDNTQIGLYSGGSFTSYAENTDLTQLSSNGSILVVQPSEDGVGGLVGSFYGDYDYAITRSFFDGAVEAPFAIGGLAGYMSNGYILDSYSEAAVTIGDGSSFEGSFAGGVVGYLQQSSLDRTYFAGYVDRDGIADNLGGLTGSLYNSNIYNSFSAGHVETAEHAGAIAGQEFGLEMSNTYYDFTRGFQGGCVYDSEFDGCEPVNIEPEDEQEDYFFNNFTNNPFFDEWNFSSRWGTTDTYPVLRWNPSRQINQVNYEIENCEDLQNINSDLGGEFTLVNDIDCDGSASWNSGAGFLPIGLGTSDGFTGLLDGNGYSIYNLSQDRSQIENSDGGLFYKVTGAVLTDFTIKNSDFVAQGSAGSLATYSVDSEVNRVNSSASIDSLNEGGPIASGGLFGQMWAEEYGSLVDQSSFTGSIDSYSITGGIAGAVLDGYVSNSFTNANINLYGNGIRIGGIIGSFDSGTIESSYSASSVNVMNDGDYAGGLVGYLNTGAQVSRSFASGYVSTVSHSGGLVGRQAISGNITNSFYDREGTQQLGCVNGVSVLGCDLQNAENSDPNYFKYNLLNAPMDDWDQEVWRTVRNGYPQLIHASEKHIKNCDDLQNIHYDITSNYTLDNDIECSDTEDWNGGEGFLPIALGYEDGFSGALTGNGYEIQDLHQNRLEAEDGREVGMFYAIRDGFVSDLIMSNGTFEGEVYGGSIAAYGNRAQIRNVSSNAYVETFNSLGAGGLIGNLNGDINNPDETFIEHSYFGGDVRGGWNVGGLVGYTEESLLVDTYNYGTVILKDEGEWAGGLVGSAWDTYIDTSYNAGYVTIDGGSAHIGGILGGIGGDSSVYASFNAGHVDQLGTAGAVAAASTGGDPVTEQVYFDASAATIDDCFGQNVNPDGCIGINYEGDNEDNYFKNNSTVPPFKIDGQQIWAFRPSGIWYKNAFDYPTFEPAVYDYEISNCTQLQNINDDLYGHYEITQDINCSETSSWNDGDGFVPIGRGSYEGFKGNLDGNGHTITGLHQDTTAYDGDQSFGLFSSAFNSTIERITIEDSDFNGQNRGGTFVGLAQNTWLGDLHSNATINTIGSYATGGIVGETYNFEGDQDPGADLYESSFTGTITGDDVIGGLAGITNNYQVYDSFFNGTIDADYVAGGIIAHAQNNSFISSSYSAGTINAVQYGHVGGLIGTTYGNPDIWGSFTVADVNGGENPQGAVVGHVNAGDVSIANTYYDQQQTGQDHCVNFSDATGCFAVNTGELGDETDETYFINNNNVFPLVNWNFAGTWIKNEDQLPLFDHIIESHNISTCQDFQEIADRPWDIYTITNDIDCSETREWNSLGEGEFAGFAPINNFTGEIEGNNHKISGLYINRSGDWGVAPFYEIIDEAQILDVNFEDVDITGYGDVAGVTAYMSDDTLVATVGVSGNIAGNYTKGGVTAITTTDNYENIVIADSTTDLNFTDGVGSSPYQWGGLTGANFSYGGQLVLIGNNVSTVMDDDDSSNTFGGLLGRSEAYEGGNVAIPYNRVEGFSSCVASCGGLVGDISSEWDGESDRHALAVFSNEIDFGLYGNQKQGGLIGAYHGNGFDAEISGNSFIGYVFANNGYAGGLIGFTESIGHNPNISLSRNSVEGDISANTSEIGGFIGVQDSNVDVQIADSYFNGSVNAGVEFAGGFVGRSYGDIDVQTSYVAGSVSAVSGYAGGMFGSILQGSVVDSFAAANVSDAAHVGAISGHEEDIAHENVVIDALRAEQGCDWCTTVNTTLVPNPDYFFANDENNPLSLWNFGDVWHMRLSDYPTLTPFFGQEIQCSPTSSTKTSISINCGVYPDTNGISTWEMQYKKLDSDSWTDVELEDNHFASATINNLKQATWYRVQFRYTNDGGTSDWGYADIKTQGTAAKTSSNNKSSGDAEVTPSTNVSLTNSDTSKTKITLNDFVEFFNQGKRLTLKVGQVIYFTVGDEEHSATVKEIGTDYVIITLASTPQDVRIGLNQTVRRDVTGNGQDDIQITLNKVKDGTADLTFVSLAQTEKVVQNKSIIEQAASAWWLKILAIVLILYVIRRQVLRLKTKE